MKKSGGLIQVLGRAEFHNPGQSARNPNYKAMRIILQCPRILSSIPSCIPFQPEPAIVVCMYIFLGQITPSN